MCDKPQSRPNWPIQLTHVGSASGEPLTLICWSVAFLQAKFLSNQKGWKPAKSVMLAAVLDEIRLATAPSTMSQKQASRVKMASQFAAEAHASSSFLVLQFSSQQYFFMPV